MSRLKRRRLQAALICLALGSTPLAAEAPLALDVDAAVGSVRSLLAEQDWAAALQQAERHYRAAPDDPRLVSLYGEALFRAGQLEQISQLLQPIAEGEDAPARALMTLGRLRNAEGRRSEAVEWMRRAVEAAGDDPEVLYRASEAAASRAESLQRLRRYLDLAQNQPEERVTGARSSVQFYETLGERPIWLDLNRPRSMELPLTLLWNEATGQTQGYVIRARIGKSRKPVRLLLDSGSPGLLLIERKLRKRLEKQNKRRNRRFDRAVYGRFNARLKRLAPKR